MEINTYQLRILSLNTTVNAKQITALDFMEKFTSTLKNRFLCTLLYLILPPVLLKLKWEGQRLREKGVTIWRTGDE